VVDLPTSAGVGSMRPQLSEDIIRCFEIQTYNVTSNEKIKHQPGVTLWVKKSPVNIRRPFKCVSITKHTTKGAFTSQQSLSIGTQIMLLKLSFVLLDFFLKQIT